MRSIPERVAQIINEMPHIEELLHEGTLNITAFARSIQPELERSLLKPVQIGSIVMAIKRLPLSKTALISFQIKDFISRLGDITVRSNLSDYTFQNSDTLRAVQSKLLEILSHRPDVFCTISQGVYETTLVVSAHFEDEFRRLFEKERLLNCIVQLASITIKLPTENASIPGVYYFIFRKLAQRGINLVEVISTTNEFTILTTQADVEKAFGILKNLKV